RQDRCGNGFVNGSLDGPASLARVRDSAGELRQLRITRQRCCCQVQQPGGNDATPSPYLGNIGEVEVVLIMFRIAQRRRLRVNGMLLLADVGVAQDIQPLSVGSHEAVLDAVVYHLDEVAAAIGSAMEIAILGSSAELVSAGSAVNVALPRR